MFGDFVWWQGVVEDREDPLFLGRCRVRVLGYHTDNKVDGIGIQTDDLPWATPMQPITSAAMNGVGTTPLGPVEGTWVFGFFRDGKNAQEPVMMGTFGGIPEKVSNPELGFNDPNGDYPLSDYLNESDTNRLARGIGTLEEEPKKHPSGSKVQSESLKHKIDTRQSEIPVGVAGDISTTIPNTPNSPFYGVLPWNEPTPRYGGKTSPTSTNDNYTIGSTYPLNHVRQSESGHVEEWDDTPGAERIHTYHKTGTFEEIQSDGTKMTKIVGDEYEITLGYKDVFIQGTCNITVLGDCRRLYMGDVVDEIYGDYHLNIHGDRRTKITGNDAGEVLADRKWVINGNDDLNVKKDQILNIDFNKTTNVGGIFQETVKDKVIWNYQDTFQTTTKGAIQIMGQDTLDITSKDNLGISSTAGDIDITASKNYNLTTSDSDIKIRSGGVIHLNDHKA